MRFHHLSGASCPMIAIVIALAAAPLPATAVLSAEALDVAVEELSGFVAYWSEGIRIAFIEDRFDSCADVDECGYTEEICTENDCTETFYSCGGNASFWASQRDAVFAKECTSDGFVAVSVCNPEFSPPPYVYDLGIDKCDTDSIHLTGFDWSVEDCDDGMTECQEQVAAKYLTDDYNDGTDFITSEEKRKTMRFHHLSGASCPMIAIVIALAAAPLPATAVLSAEALDVAVEELSGFVAYWSEGIRIAFIEDRFDSCADVDECGYTEEICTENDCTETFYSCGGNASFWASQRDAVFAKECTSDGFVAVSVCNPEFSPPPYVYDLGIDKCDTDSIHLTGFDWSVEDCDDGMTECQEQVAAKYLTDDYNDGTDFINASSNNSSGVSKVMRGVAIYAAVLGNTTVTLGSTAGAFVAWKPKVLYASFAVNGSANTSVVFTDVMVMGGIVSFDGGSAIVGGGVTDEASLVSFKSSLPVRLEGLENGGNVTFTDCTDVIIANTLNLGTVVLTNSVASVSNITNRGTVEISGGTYLYSGGSNHGTITVSGNVDAELVSDTNAGTIEVSNVGGTVSATIGSNDGIISVLAGSTATATIGTNVGTITISDSSTGTLAVTCNTGTITYAGNVITGDFSDGSVGITILGTCSATTDAQPTAAPSTNPVPAPSTNPVPAPTTSPTPDCHDTTWTDGKNGKGCDWVAQSPERRCNKRFSSTNMCAHEGCPLTCDNCDGCFDDKTWADAKNGKGCWWIARDPDKRCTKRSSSVADGEVPATDACLFSCENCGA
eukprot:CAMPEP_0185791656 /NCGR_PEP_ID=MMETSP1174-20130828/158498_1 /TAXON_ID=35687 /ORGANISM="Dictyocha speculum, Strain CCMP1381" /LENGTH=780 /DNA_ID=CAMNT_0028486637 /DNA_START=32 /DNA_END=2374 /DNA_ORIENTATION=-